MSNILWTHAEQPSGKIIRAAAALAGVPVELPDGYVHYYHNRESEYLAKFPHGKIPGLEQPDGFTLFESVPIMRYICRLNPSAGLLGNSLMDSALVDQWVHLAESEIDVLNILTNRLCRGFMKPYDAAIHDMCIERQQRALQTLNTHLATRTYFVGDMITLADLYVAGIIQRAVSITLDAKARVEVPHLIRHLESIVGLPKVKDIFGPIDYIEKAIRYIPPKKRPH